MCRSIKTLFNLEPPANDDEIRAAALQFVRKISGFRKPSAANQEAFDKSVEKITRAAAEVLGSLVTNAPAKNRDIEATKAHARAVRRFGA